MKSTILRGACLALLGLIAHTVDAQQSIIPPPGPPTTASGGSPYYATLNSTTAASGPVIASVEPIPAANPGMVDPALGVAMACHAPGTQPAGCYDAGELWANACDPQPPGILNKFLNRYPDNSSDASIGCHSGTIGCDSVVDSCSGLCGASDGCQGGCGLWAHYTTVYASLLYLRPRNADVAYAVPIDGPITSAPANNPIQIGDVGVVDPNFETGFSGGINLAVNSKTSVFAEAMVYDNTETDSIATTAPNVLRSIVSHPSSASVSSDFLSGSASLELELDSLDLGIRHLFVGGQVFAVNYIVGARYSSLDQNFNAEFISNGAETVQTTIDFEGIGPRIGFEAERQSCRNRMRIYTRSSASFLAGRFQTTYFQGQSFDPTVVDTYWEAGRVVPVLDFELGAGWTSAGGCVRLSAGYLVSSWFNTVKTEDFIRSVQNNDFIELHDTLTFDGLRATAELRF